MIVSEYKYSIFFLFYKTFFKKFIIIFYTNKYKDIGANHSYGSANQHRQTTNIYNIGKFFLTHPIATMDSTQNLLLEVVLCSADMKLAWMGRT